MKMKYLYMSFLLALVYSCSDSGDNSDYSEMLKKDFNQEIKCGFIGSYESILGKNGFR